MTTSHKVSLGVGATLLCLLAAFLLTNRQPTEVNFLVGTFVVSRALLVLGFFAAGFLAGWLAHSLFLFRRRPSRRSSPSAPVNDPGK